MMTASREDLRDEEVMPIVLTDAELADEVASWDNANSEKIPLGGLIRRLALTAQKARAENVCDACAGDPSSVKDGKCMCRGTGKMSEAAIYLREQLVASERDLNNLLARVFGDGGHYVERHGLKKAVEDADKDIAEMRAGVRQENVKRSSTHDLQLNRYERDNLACLFAALHAGGYCGSGDWFGQILGKLCPSKRYGEPITPPEDANPNMTPAEELESLRSALGVKR
jgi:hypothetical protein